MAIPDQPNFSLSQVLTEVGVGSANGLTTAFGAAVAAYFDPLYEGTKDRLSNFRNYNSDITPPSIPTNLAFTQPSAGIIQLTWTASTGSPVLYNIYRSTTLNGTYTKESSSAASPWSNAHPAGTYYFKITAVDAADNESGLTAAVGPVTV